MIEMNDEYLNRFIDGDLSDEESAEFRKGLSSDPAMRKKYETMLRLEKNLKSMRIAETSPDFTAKMMTRLRKKPAHYKAQNFFIFSVTGFMTIIILGLTIYIFGNSLSQAAESTSGSFNFTGFLENIIHDWTSVTGKLFNPKHFSIIGSLISVIILISGYFFFETHKRVIKKRF